MLASSSSSSSSSKKDGEHRAASMAHCFAGFEAMGCLLRQYQTLLLPVSSHDDDGGGDSGCQTIITFKANVCRHDPPDSNTLWMQIFPVPNIKRGNVPLESSLSTTSSSYESLLFARSYTLGLQMAMTIFTVLINSASCDPRMKKAVYIDIAAEFGTFPCTLFADVTEKGTSGSLEICSSLFNGIIVPWIHFSATNIGPECFDDIFMQGKRAHRIFWEAVAASQSMPSAYYHPQEMALQLRQQSILALLLCRPNEPTLLCLRSDISEHMLDTACTDAWKAAASFRYRPDEESDTATHRKILLSFHQHVGFAIYSVEEQRGNSLSYAEYCAYRALRLGPDYIDVTQSSTIKTAGQATFALFLLALQLSTRLGLLASRNKKGNDQPTTCFFQR